MKETVYLCKLKTNRIQGVTALRRCFPLMGLKEAIDLVSAVSATDALTPKECPYIEAEPSEVILLMEQFNVWISEPRGGPIPGVPFIGMGAYLPQPTVTLHYPDGTEEGVHVGVYGDAKDVADAIYRLMDEGHSRDEIKITTPGAWA